MAARNPFWNENLAGSRRSTEPWRNPDGILNLELDQNGNVIDTYLGILETREVYDHIILNLVQGRTYFFVVQGEGFQPDLGIFDNQGWLLSYSDPDFLLAPWTPDRPGEDSIVTFVPSYTGRHYLDVSSNTGSGTGRYTLVASDGTLDGAVVLPPLIVSPPVAAPPPPPPPPPSVNEIAGTSGNDVLTGIAGRENRMIGGAGDDVLVGTAGNDTMDGGVGIDVAIIARTNAISFAGAGDRVTVDGGSGQDLMIGVELVIAGDRVHLPAGDPEGVLVKTGVASGAFDEAFYLKQNPDVAAAVRGGFFKSGADHFTAFGHREGRDPHLFFDTDYYLTKNPDVAAAVASGGWISAWEHFTAFGWREGRDPAAWFDLSEYRLNNVLGANINPVDDAVAGVSDTLFPPVITAGDLAYLLG